MLERRRQRQPASQILGTREFWGLEFEVSPEVLDPRPDSETVVTAALGVIGTGPRLFAFSIWERGPGVSSLRCSANCRMREGSGSMWPRSR